MIITIPRTQYFCTSQTEHPESSAVAVTKLGRFMRWLCPFICSFVSLLSHSLHGSTWRRVGAYRIALFALCKNWRTVNSKLLLCSIIQNWEY